MNERKVGVAIVGCGNIAGPYARDLASYDHINLVGVADVDETKAAALAAKHGCRQYASLEALLDDPAVDLVVNLTIHHAHYAVTRQCLDGGKHVYSEKPMALTAEEAQELVELARSKGVRLGCSPATWMGEAQQTAWKCIREGQAGQVRVAYAEVNWGRIETWHPAPQPFYAVGPLFDVGVYPLTILTAIFGPARRVSAFGTIVHPERVTKTGEPFRLQTPDWVVAVVELANGTLARLTTNFYVGTHNKQTGIEFHGDLGSVYLSSWQNFDASIEFAQFNQKYASVQHVKEPYKGTEWGRGVREMTEAIAEGRPHRTAGEHAAHVVEILCATVESIQSNQAVQIQSTFTAPAPMDWAV